MLVSAKELLSDAQRNHYAVAAFNFYNLDTLMAIIDAAEQEQAPMIAQLYSSHFLYYGGMFLAAARAALEKSSVPIALHLDHGSDISCIEAAIASGFNSVMFDGSQHSIGKNICDTKTAVKMAHDKGIFTEAEVGAIGRADTSDAGYEYAKLDDVIKLVNQSGVDSLAAAIGTAHGLYTKEPQIAFDLLTQIRAAVDVPLVLHGGSGTPEKSIVKAIELGICKINVGTELKYAWSAAVKEAMLRGEREPVNLAQIARKKVAEVAREKIRLFGSNGRARSITNH